MQKGRNRLWGAGGPSTAEALGAPDSGACLQWLRGGGGQLTEHAWHGGAQGRAATQQRKGRRGLAGPTGSFPGGGSWPGAFSLYGFLCCCCFVFSYF